MSEKMKIEVGQEVVLERMGNAARNSQEPIKATVKSVGRKYFEVGHYGKFCLETGLQQSDYSCNYKVHLNEQSLLDRIERRKLDADIEQRFRYGSTLTLDQLKRIKIIIDEK